MTRKKPGTGMRSLSEVLDGRKRILPYGDDHALAVALGFPNVVYAARDGKVIELPVTRRSEKRVYLGDSYVKRDQLEGTGAAFCQGWPRDKPDYVYATRGLAAALLGEWLPSLPPAPLDAEDAAKQAEQDRRELRRVLRFGYERAHDAVDELGREQYITGEQAARLHADIDARCKADGYWDDGLPECWWLPEVKYSCRSGDSA